MFSYIGPTVPQASYLQPKASGKPVRRASLYSLVLFGLGGLLLLACQSTPQPTPSLKPAAIQPGPTASSPQVLRDFVVRFNKLEDEHVRALLGCLEKVQPKTNGPLAFGRPLALTLTRLFEADPRGYPAQLATDCLPLGRKAIAAFAGVTTQTVPPELTPMWSQYRQALELTVKSLAQWAEEAPSWASLVEDRETLEAASHTAMGAWGEAAKDPVLLSRVWLLQRFLLCAVPDLAQLKNSEALVLHFDAMCLPDPPEAAFIARMDRCLPLLRTLPEKPEPQFKQTFERLHVGMWLLAPIWQKCLPKLTQGSRRATATDATDSAWTEFLEAGLDLRNYVQIKTRGAT